MGHSLFMSIMKTNKSSVLCVHVRSVAILSPKPQTVFAELGAHDNEWQSRRLVCCAQTSSLVGTRGNNKTNNQAVQSKGFCEDEDQDHTNKQAWLLGIGSHTCITDNAN